MNTESKVPLLDYLHALEKELAVGNATEHTHRTALKIMLESLGEKTTATNEPQRIKCGAPDFIITKGSLTIGYIETKDIDKSLDETEKTEQIKRYMDSLSNFVLTDYLEFRWFIDGKLRLKARLGVTSSGKIKHTPDGIEQVDELLINFLKHQAERVGTPKELALRMARLAHLIRNLIINTFTLEAEKGSLHAQLAAFRENLIPDLSSDEFADMYAQTIAYGLFAARCTSPDSKDFTRQNAAYLLPKTNPFLRQLFNHIAGPELDERIAWCVDDLAQILDQADIAEVLKDFGKKMGKEDPVVHFYETFLKAYAPAVKEMRGVYYTPEPVVSYIVRSIDYLLKTRFDKPQGLADDNTLILDPATGTATFLYMVINKIRQSFAGQEGMWNDYVAEKLLPRIFGFELLMAPYAVAHLKLGLLLQETGYKFHSDERLGIFLTNTLDEAFKHAQTLFAQWISEEANAAAEIKKTKPIMVVLGNPPYSGISANASVRTVIDLKTNKTKQELTWIGKLIEDYKVVDGKPLNERKHWLQDDYVKFIRFGQWRIKETGEGILAFITNHSYLDNPTFRGMRQALMNTFTDIYILNLHGNVKKREIAPDGSKDENVFDIQQGVAIGIFVKEANKDGLAKVHYSDLWGLREGKYQALFQTDVNDTVWKELTPNTPFYFFVQREEELRPEYDNGWNIAEAFTINSTGIVTSRDDFVIDFEPSPIQKRIEVFLDNNLSDGEVKEKLSLSENYAWRISEARKQLMAVKDRDPLFSRILYRPFDIRSIFYHPSVVWRTRSNVMNHLLLGNNLSLCIGRAGQVVGPDTWDLILCSKLIDDFNLYYRGGNVNFPLYLYPTEGEMQFGEGHHRHNLNPDFIKAFSEKLGLMFIEDGKGNLTDTFGPEDIFNYAYAVFHSPTYRTRYAEFLKIDFPRLPLTSDKALFKALSAKGAELVSLHLMESPALNKPITKYPITGPNTVDKVSYDDNNQLVNINKEQYFEGVPPEVWNFHIGGYQVCHKWLKDRKGRTLTYDELTHYQKIMVALKETIRLMTDIDALITKWPIE